MNSDSDDDDHLDVDNASVADSFLRSTLHDRERRKERGINKIDLQNARRYGIEERGQDHDRVKLTYGGVVFIYDPVLKTSITTYPSRDYASEDSGTKVTKPVVLSKKEEFRTRQQKDAFSKARYYIIQHKELWNSHSVLVVDMSASMRKDDVNGARCRADGVWTAIARDFVRQQIESNSVSLYDLVSVVLFRDKAETLFIAYPIGWCLYNEFVSMRDWKVEQARPRGPGNYLPALVEAETLLDINPSSKCSLSLMFFSDGRPSDNGNFVKKMGGIASKYGRRLAVSCVGIARGNDEDFSVLERMTEEAGKYGAVASFNRPTLNLVSLSAIVTSLASSVATSKAEMTDFRSRRMRCVRTDIRREHRFALDDTQLTSDWWTFHNKDSKKFVSNIWTWNWQAQDFVLVMDPRCIYCYTTVADTSCNANRQRGMKCQECEACFSCHSCIRKHNWSGHRGKKACRLKLKQRRQGLITKHPVPSFNIAIKKFVFDEGAERLVSKVRFLDDERSFVGPKMVAKESRFIEETEDGEGYNARMQFHRDFLRTQYLASEFADMFNDELAKINDAERMPCIKFLKPFVVQCQQGKKEWNVLIEEQLDGDYRKFNNNMGHVRGQGRCGGLPKSGRADLGIIEEGSEEEEEDEEVIFRNSNVKADHGDNGNTEPGNEDILQAFSHFTYVKSKKMLMVVDLQGILKQDSDGTRQYLLTDPAIHKRTNAKGSERMASWNFGRTDRGEHGMRAFMTSHKCNDVCQMLGLGVGHDELVDEEAIS